MPASGSEPTTWVFTKRLGLGRVAQPNGSRLSCGALKKDSFLRIYARRQLQALVRLRTTSHSSGPSSPGAQSGTHRRLTPMGTVRPNGPLLGTRHARRAPSATGPSFGKRFRIEPNHPDGCRLQTRSRPRRVFIKRLGFGRVAQPNGSRLSCGALKKDSFLNVRAPPASSAC